MSCQKKIILADPRGFCSGVKSALDIFDRTVAKFGKPVYVLYELVHNKTVSQDMLSKGAVFVDSIDEVPVGATLLFGAHGVSPQLETAAADRKLNVVDATCPLVKKLQNSAAAIPQENALIVFGSSEHPEIRSVISRAGTGKIFVISGISEVNSLPDDLEKPVFLSQTTRNDDEIKEIAAALKAKYPDLHDASGVCNAVFARQNAVKNISAKCDTVLVCGSAHSSNASRLREIAEQNGSKACLIDSTAEIPQEIVDNSRTIGIAAGASTPEKSVRDVIKFLTGKGFEIDPSLFIKEKSPEELEQLCGKIRQKIISTVAANGGHLSAALGCVELITAIHYVFDTPKTEIIFDVGHQAHAHKLLTGRWDDFDNMRKTGGISGFTSCLESKHDTGISGHAGNSLSTAIGICAGKKQRNDNSKVIAVIGDASLGNGTALEGLNAAAGAKNLLIILNDNKMAISPNRGAFSRYLNRLISHKKYNNFRNRLRLLLNKFPAHEKLHRIFSKIDDLGKSTLMPAGTIFQEIGLRYIGPVDGHSLTDLIPILQFIRNESCPILLHVKTCKGKGCSYAEKSPTLYHGIGKFDPATGIPLNNSNDDFSSAFGKKLCELAQKNPRIEAITAAMPDGTGLRDFMQQFPARAHDAGIAEEHAVTFAAGLAIAGRKPVCAVYSTFFQRAFDAFYHDIVLPQLPVIIALDRCGIVPDGPTHHGIYDLGFLRQMHGIEILSPSTRKELEMMLDYLMTVNHPAVIRYPRGSAKERENISAVKTGKAEIVTTGQDVVIWALGHMVDTALETTELLKAKGIDAGVINTRFIAPFDHETAHKYANTPTVTLEDHCVSGGLGSTMLESLANIPHHPVLVCGWPQGMIPHGDTAEIKKIYGLDPVSLAGKIYDFVKNSKTE